MAISLFSGLNDTNLNYDAVIKSGDIYVQKYEYISVNNATLDNSTPAAATLTLNDSHSFVADEFNSSAAYNLLIVDDNGVVGKAKIVDCALSSTDFVITFDSTACLLESDGTTAVTLTDTGTYKIAILTGDDTNVYGKFWGYVNGNSLEISEEYAEYFYGIPQSLKFRDLTKRSFNVTGGNLMVANKDVVQALYNSVNYGSQTGQWSQGIGFTPSEKPYYRMTVVNSDKNNRDYIVQFRKGQFSLNGAFDFYSTVHKVLPYSFMLFSDGFYPADADAILISRSN